MKKTIKALFMMTLIITCILSVMSTSVFAEGSADIQPRLSGGSSSGTIVCNGVQYPVVFSISYTGNTNPSSRSTCDTPAPVDIHHSNVTLKISVRVGLNAEARTITNGANSITRTTKLTMLAAHLTYTHSGYASYTGTAIGLASSSGRVSLNEDQYQGSTKNMSTTLLG